MALNTQIEKLEALLQKGKVAGTGRALVSLDTLNTLIEEMRSNMPQELNEADTVMRQRDAIIQMAEEEARRIREYADKEASTIRDMAEEQSSQKVATARKEASGMVEDTNIKAEAEKEAGTLIGDAEARANQIVANGRDRANNIVNEAEREASQRRSGADKYAREVLFGLEERIVETLGQIRSGLDLLDNPTPTPREPEQE